MDKHQHALQILQEIIKVVSIIWQLDLNYASFWVFCQPEALHRHIPDG